MTQLVRKFRFYWDDADHVIERWLEQMAREGLHLKRVCCMRMVFVFERGEPADVTYRIDFRLTRADAHYLQLFHDAGWERADEALGWQFWRAPSGSMRVAEIFTDVQSRALKYKQIAWLLVMPLMLALPNLALHFSERWQKRPAMLALSLAADAVAIYSIVRLLRRVRSLRGT